MAAMWAGISAACKEADLALLAAVRVGMSAVGWTELMAPCGLASAQPAGQGRAGARMLSAGMACVASYSLPSRLRQHRPGGRKQCCLLHKQTQLADHLPAAQAASGSHVLRGGGSGLGSNQRHMPSLLFDSTRCMWTTR